jgi:hypothetical protein
LHAELARERVTHRLTAGCLHRDLAAFQRRVAVAAVQHAALREADQVLDDVLARPSTFTDPHPEGGPV